MSVSESDIVLYGSANMPENDIDTAGGAIDTSRKLTFTDISATDNVEVVSDDAGDTSQSVDITGRLSDGTLVTETINLNGTTAATSTNQFERVLKAVKSATTAGTVTVRKASDDVAIMTFDKTPSEIMDIRRIFFDVAADAAGGSPKTFYAKGFLKNNNGSTALTSAVVKENADPSGNITFALANTLDDTESVANRTTAPSSTTAFDNTDKNVANSQNHSAGSGQGVWFKLDLAAGAAAADTTYTVREEGNTT